MSNKRLLFVSVTLWIVACIILVGCGSSKIKKQVEEGMRDKYGEEFKVEDTWKSSSWAGTKYYAYVRSEKHPEYRIKVRFDDGKPETMRDDYVQKCVYGRFSDELQNTVASYFSKNFLWIENGYDTYFNFGPNIDMSIEEMNAECPGFGIGIFVEKDEFSFQKAYDLMSEIRNRYGHLSGSMVVYVAEDGKLENVKKQIDNDESMVMIKDLIGDSKFGEMKLQGDKIAYDEFVREFNDYGHQLK